jgi:hypothetical protein
VGKLGLVSSNWFATSPKQTPVSYTIIQFVPIYHESLLEELIIDENLPNIG